jgi:ribosomal protein S18 acetylase RimI-like enzyme
MPWPSPAGLRETLGALGAGALVYSAVVLRRALRQRTYRPVGEDWLWHVLLPTAAYIAVLSAAFLFMVGHAVPLFAVGVATLLLLCVGIHNAWDTVIYLTVTTLQHRRTSHTQGPLPGATAPPVTPTEPAPIIRAAVPADLPAIGKLGALLVRTHHAFDPERFIPATPRTEHGYADFLGTQLGRPGVVVLVAELNGQVAGYAYSGLEGKDYMALRGPAGAVYDLVVDPAQRGRGIGRRLLDETLAALKALGAPRAVLSTAEQNTTAQRLFARAGFRGTMREMTRELGGATS